MWNWVPLRRSYRKPFAWVISQGPWFWSVIEKVVYRQAFGDRSLVPQKLPMTPETVFDLASITKVVATTTALMQLVEGGSVSKTRSQNIQPS